MRVKPFLVPVVGGLASAVAAFYAGWRYFLWQACRASAAGGCDDPHATYFLVLGSVELALLALAALIAFASVAVVLRRLLGTGSRQGPTA